MGNDDVLQILKAINDLREEVRENKREIQKSREIENIHWQENQKLWKQNEKEHLEFRKEIESLKSDVKEIKSDMKQDKKHIEDILWSFQTSVENMFNENKREIRELQKIVEI